jgi:uncharacterized membrane protein
MMNFDNTIVIQRPVEEVFRFVADFENVPKWNYYVTQVRQTTGGSPDKGTVYHQIRKNDEQDYRVVDYQPHQKLGVKTLEGSKPAFERLFIFEETDNGTRITDKWQLDTGHNPLLQWVGRGKVKASVAENLGKLKQLLEEGRTRLQDGRVVTI